VRSKPKDYWSPFYIKRSLRLRDADKSELSFKVIYFSFHVLSVPFCS
jgi:hypothetical protein